MVNSTTSVSNMRVEDITFHGGRSQSQIVEDLGLDKEIKHEHYIEPPKSLTLEQIRNYYKLSLEATPSMDEKRLFQRTLQILDEYEENKAKLRKYILKEYEQSRTDETVSDIQE